MGVEGLLPGVDLISRNLPGSSDFPVQAVMVRGTRHRVVIDTLIQAPDMAPCHDATLVVYTHSDWDHCWGTAALPGVPVIGCELTYQRLASREAREYLASMQKESPAEFRESAIILPDIIFRDHLRIDAGGLTLHLEHLPGHTADSVVAYIPEVNLLLAGDAVETPIPCLNEAGHIRDWVTGLRRWSQAGLRCVVPSHGQAGGPDLLLQNAHYIEELLGRVGRLLEQGLGLEAIQKQLPVEEFAPDIDRYPSFYRQGHLENIAQVVAELSLFRP